MSGFVTTPNYNLRKPVVGGDDDAWGDDLNFNADTLDAQLKAVSNLQVLYLPLAGGVLAGPLTVPKLNISAIPTSATGLVHGDVWSNGGVLMVVP